MDLEKYGKIDQLIDSEKTFSIPLEYPYFPDASERCVEIPFVFSEIGNAKNVIDIGISLSDPVYFNGLLTLVKRGISLSALDIVPIDKVRNRFVDFDRTLVDKISVSVGDVRYYNKQNGEFDLLLCVSVLEHIGFDKYIDATDTVFDRPFQLDSQHHDFLAWREDEVALKNMMNLVTPGGRMILTVPYGAGGVFHTKDSKNRIASHLEYNDAKWKKLKSSLPECVWQDRFFRMRGSEGWREISGDDKFDSSHGSNYREEGVVCTVITKA